MGTNIEWCDETWNPVIGCFPVSAGCENCYAAYSADMNVKRFKQNKYEGLVKVLNNKERKWTGEVRFLEEELKKPLKWKTGKKIFVNSMSDVFHEKLTVEQIAKIWAVMFTASQHTYMILTKRAKRMREILNSDEFKFEFFHAVNALHIPNYKKEENEVFDEENPLPLFNVLLGVSVEDQTAANERIPELLKTQAHTRFVSMEPLLAEVDLEQIYLGKEEYSHSYCCLSGEEYQIATGFSEKGKEKIDWVIVGGESGHYARPMSRDWAIKIRDACIRNCVPFFFKQWGEWVGLNYDESDNKYFYENSEPKIVVLGKVDELPKKVVIIDHEMNYKCGKKEAGRSLDGEYFNQFPTIKSE